VQRLLFDRAGGGLEGERSLLLLDDSTEKEKKNRLKQSFRELRRHIRPAGFDPGLEFIHDDMYFGSSKDSIGIQLADLCAYFIGKHLDGGDPAAEGFYQIFEKEIVNSRTEPE
jgi:hypothetical protein